MCHDGHGPAPRSRNDNIIPGPTATRTATFTATNLSPNSHSDPLSDRAASAPAPVAHLLALLRGGPGRRRTETNAAYVNEIGRQKVPRIGQGTIDMRWSNRIGLRNECGNYEVVVFAVLPTKTQPRAFSFASSKMIERERIRCLTYMIRKQRYR